FFFFLKREELKICHEVYKMSDRRPYSDDPSRYPYPPDYFRNPNSSSDPGMSSGYNNPY
ncbi:hypothetical protein MKW98_001179, partial [Papaver atlanticum]